jgi:hypothetical protein
MAFTYIYILLQNIRHLHVCVCACVWHTYMCAIAMDINDNLNVAYCRYNAAPYTTLHVHNCTLSPVAAIHLITRRWQKLLLVYAKSFERMSWNYSLRYIASHTYCAHHGIRRSSKHLHPWRSSIIIVTSIHDNLVILAIIEHGNKLPRALLVLSQILTRGFHKQEMSTPIRLQI